jgi:predicted dehydrogenase
MDGVDRLLEAASGADRVVQVGYNLQFEPALERVKELIDGGAIGRVVWARAEYGQYLPDWRPWQDYRRSYTARRELGGGIVLDASHELAYLMWLLGTPVEVRAMGGTVGGLEVDVEDSATVLLRFADGAQADVHVDFLQRQPARECKVVGVEGTVVLDLLTGELELLPLGEREVFRPDDDLAYRAELSHFLDCVRTRANPRVDLAFGRDVLAVALAALEQIG